MTDWLQYTDEIGPEKIVHVHNPAVGMKGVVVIDSTALGGMTGGGIRMMPDITTGEICGLARAMTYKWNAVDLPIGGCKSGIWANPAIRGEEREAVLKAFGQAIRPAAAERLEYRRGHRHGGQGPIGHLRRRGDGVEFHRADAGREGRRALENHATGYGVVVAAKAACEFAGIDLNGATMAWKVSARSAGAWRGMPMTSAQGGRDFHDRRGRVTTGTAWTFRACSRNGIPRATGPSRSWRARNTFHGSAFHPSRGHPGPGRPAVRHRQGPGRAGPGPDHFQHRQHTDHGTTAKTSCSNAACTWSRTSFPMPGGSPSPWWTS